MKRLKLQATSRGRPLGNAKAVVLFDDNRIQMARSLEDGMATVGIPAGRNVASLSMWSEGHGFDYVVYQTPRSQAAAISPLTPQPEGTVPFELDGGRDVAIQLVDETGAPLEGVTVYPWILEKPGQPDSMNFAQVQRQFQQVTDAEGWVRFDWLPDWNARPITFWALKAGFARGRIEADLTKVDHSPLKFTLQRLVEVSGEVVDSEGQPVPAANILATGDGYVDDLGFGQTVSDEHGRFHLKLPPGQLYLVRVTSQDQLSAGSIDALVVRSGQPQPDVNIKLSAAIRVFGQLPPGPDQKPQSGATITIKHYGRDLQTLEKDSLPNPAGLTRKIQPSHYIDVKADQRGRFEVRLSPGEYDIRTNQGREAHKITIMDQAEIELNFILDDNPDR